METLNEIEVSGIYFFPQDNSVDVVHGNKVSRFKLTGTRVLRWIMEEFGNGGDPINDTDNGVQ